MAQGFFARLLGIRATPPPLAPPTPQERARLAHHRRKVERSLRQLEKHLKHAGCGPCVQAAPSRSLIRLEQQRDRLRRELAHVDARLAMDDAA